MSTDSANNSNNHPNHAATNSATANLNNNANFKTSPDIASLLQQLSNLQNDRERLAKELELSSKELSTLKENKREEMRKVFDTVIQKWLNDSVNNEDVRKQFSDGMQRIIEKTHENGLWTVAVEASNLHAKQIEELEQLRSQCEQLKQHNPSFNDENSRKRPREESGQSNDFWTGFELDITSVS